MTHPNYKLYYAELHELMRHMGAIVQRGRGYYNQVGAYNMAIDMIEFKVKSLGNPPCPICGNALVVAPFEHDGNELIRMFCDTCSNITNPYPTKARAIHEVKTWIGKTNPHEQLVHSDEPNHNE